MDILTKERRSQVMSRIRGSNTKPEMLVRRTAHALGLRFRLHRKDLPGTPDIVFPATKTALFVHGCFWHRHDSCRYAYTPKSNEAFWSQKFVRNVERDREVVNELRRAGWRPIVIWECETKQGDLAARINRLLKEAA